MFEITLFDKHDGPLTKKIALDPDGKVKSDGSACVMASGTVRRGRVDDIHQFGTLIADMQETEALALGALRPGIHDNARIVCKNKLNGAAGSDIVARTADYIGYPVGQPAPALIDFDAKGMPPQVQARIAEIGGFWPALVSVLPELNGAARVMRHSTSAGLFRADTGEPLAGSGGVHVYVAVKAGADIERFLKTLHERCWLAGLGWMMVGAAGQLLERSVVDRMVGAPERLVFEADPILMTPVGQDKAKRHPIVTDGVILDTLAACPPLSIFEQAELRELRAKEAHRLAPEAAAARGTFIDRQSSRLAEHAGISVRQARRVIARQCDGVLLPNIVLPFDDPELSGTTVAAVLADPERFEGATLADPLEGIDYGRCKARIMRRADGTPWVHSFAHGRTVYELKWDAPAAQAALAKALPKEAAETFVHLVLASDLDDGEIEALRDLAHEHSGVGKRALNRKLKSAREEAALRRAQQDAERRLGERQDPRPLIPAPYPDAEWLPTMGVLNDVLGSSQAVEPPMRDFEGYLIEVRARRVRGLHALTSFGANQEDTEETRLPPPEHLLLSRLGEPEAAELIERHIEFVDDANRSVHLGAPFVKHYLQRCDDALPLCTGLSTMPIVLPDGTILSGPGLVRPYDTLFRVPQELCGLLPRLEDCTPSRVSAAMRFLTDQWLCDVATDYPGKCVIIACAATIIERALLPMRPGFFVGAGKRGGGKTTTLNMVSTAVLGQTAAAAAWSPSEEERRKALFAYFLEGVPFLVWDNIARGTTISGPSIEKSLTAEFYADRVLGFSEHKIVPITTIQCFTGNNVGPRGEMSSRSLQVVIDVVRPDPENRNFAHPDPIGWTKAHRGRILGALYTILLGNPRRRRGYNRKRVDTRFKEWMDLVGTAVEKAAQIVCDEVHGLVAEAPSTCPPAPISFKSMFLAGEADDEEDAGLAKLLVALRAKWREREFQAKDVAAFLEPENAPPTDEAREMLAALALASGKPIRNISASTVTWGLKKLVKTTPYR